LLAQSVVHEFGERAAFRVENYGESELARRFGVTRYPAIFVGDVLVATPKDFGFYGTGEGTGQGRYAPWRSAASHERFRGDLSRMIGLVSAGRSSEARAAAPAREGGEIAAMPEVRLTDLDGRPIAASELRGRPVLVEFWATWCPPCRGTLQWLGRLKQQHGDRIAVVTIALESDSLRVRKVAAELPAPLRWALGSPEIARAFGDVSAVPTLFLFDRAGKFGGAYYGAPPTLHADVEKRLASLLGGG
jgi:thiol-disulfide isomerase/thioredoxin